jgi:predicted nucleic acid-binding Zn ribbon protein
MGYLTNCRTCGKPVSTTAMMCPSCGESSPEPYKEKIKYSLIGLLVVLVFLVIVVGVGLMIYWLK